MTTELARESTVIQAKDLAALADFEDQKARAASFYLSTSSFSNMSHRQQLIAIKLLGRSIVSSHFDDYPRSNGLLADLDAVLESAERMQEGSLGFKAIFACRDQGIWREFNLPVRTDISFLKTGKCFYLVPLLKAMESCQPYCVVLVEHGKARGFVVQGTLIQEFPGCLPQRQLCLHSNDSRVGWSHHIAGDRQEHAQAYLRDLAREIPRFLAAQNCSDLVIGCREDLWSEVGPHLINSAVAAWRGQFHLPAFDASAAEVLQAAKPVFDGHKQKKHATLLGMVHENSGRGATSIPAVQEELEEGRVHTLLLGPQSDAAILKCVRCGYLLSNGVRSCTACNATQLEVVNAQEAMVRKALSTGAEIVPIDSMETSVMGEVAALLRY